MPLKKELWDILCCPVTKDPVEPLPDDRLKRLNDLIKAGSIKSIGGDVIDKPVEEAAITKNGQTIYRIDDGIPVMLADQGISADQIK